MTSSVRSRPNHYQALGLSSDASQDAIARAFARAMGMFAMRPMTMAAELGAAFETLRDPVKRRAYDKAIGLVKEPEPQAWKIAPAMPGRGGFFGMQAVATPGAAPEPFIAAAPPQPPRQEPQLRQQPQAAGDADATSFIASSLREIAKPGPFDPSRLAPPRAQPQPSSEDKSIGAAPPGTPQPIVTPREDMSFDAEDRAFDWKRPALAIGVFVAAAGLVGALAGVSVRDDEQQQVAPAATASGHTPKPHPATAALAAAAPALSEMSVESTAERPIRAREPSRTRPTASAKPPSSFVAEVADTLAAQGPAAEATATPADEASADSAPAQPVAAAMPLPNSVIARTIERIGYQCGAVASTAPVEGSSGVFNVTCTSGQTYQASSVHGRYRFRRTGR
jgi:hypothetical protein